MESSTSGHHLSAIGQEGSTVVNTTMPPISQPLPPPQQPQKQKSTDKASIDGSSASRRLRDDGRSYRSEERSDDFSIHSYRRGYKREKMPVSVGIITVCLNLYFVLTFNLYLMLGYIVYRRRSCPILCLGRLEFIRRCLLFIHHIINDRLRYV